MYFIKLRIFSNHYPVMHDATPKCRHSVGHSTQTHISKSIKTYIKAWLQAWIFFSSEVWNVTILHCTIHFSQDYNVYIFKINICSAFT